MNAGISCPALVSIGTEKSDEEPEEGGDVIELDLWSDCDNASITSVEEGLCEEVVLDADGHDDEMAAT